MVDYPCDRCGKCCFEYNGQIHFNPEAPFFCHARENLDSLSPLEKIYVRVKENFKKVVNDKIRYYVPTKAQILPFLSMEEKINLGITETNQNECIFLEWTPDHLANCVIHDLNPEMCKEYPESKGWACLNHYERRFTETFLNYQQRQIGFVVKIIKEFYREKIPDPIAWKLITFLMDFGSFPLNKVKHFFCVYFNIDSSYFDKILVLLEQNTLIRIINNDFIEGISMKEVESTVDRVMKEKGW